MSTSTNTRTDCPKCSGKGQVIENRKGTIVAECFSCGIKWRTVSRTCPKCHRPNGYLVDGICSNCYSESRADG